MSNQIDSNSRDYSFDEIEDDPRLKRTAKEFFITMAVYIIYGALMITNLFLFGQHSTIEAEKCETLTVTKDFHSAEKEYNAARTAFDKADKAMKEALKSEQPLPADSEEFLTLKADAEKKNAELYTAEEKLKSAKDVYDNNKELCSIPSIHTVKPLGLPLWIFNLICLLIGMVVTVELVCKFGYKDMPLTDEESSKEAE